MIYQGEDITKNQTVTCDVCVIGSGAGGAVVAKELAESGLNVVMIEEGGYYATKDYSVTDTIGSVSKLYREAGASVIMGNPKIMYSEGRCVGGSTVINGGMCWRTPEKIMKRWQWEFGVQDFNPTKMEHYFNRVEKHIHAKAIIPEARNQESELLKIGAQRLGYKFVENIRSQDLCVGNNTCITGCPTGAKQSTALSYVPQFIQKGGTIFTHCRVDKILTKGKRAVGVVGHFIHPLSLKPTFKLKVKASVVVSSCGAIQTPALLMKSKIKDAGKWLGKNLIVHPNAKVMGVFNDKVNAWHGVNQNYQITEYFDEGILMAVNSVAPGIMALVMPLEGYDMLARMKNEYHHITMGGVLIEDDGFGQVKLGPMGSVIPSYQLNNHDFSKIMRGVALLAEVFFAAGARKCYLPFAGLHQINSVDEIPKIFDLNFKRSDLELLTVHVMGTARMSANPKRGVVNVHGECHSVKGLFVADASVFPTSIGVNPQVTIMALANRTADYIAENFNRYL